MSASRPVNPWTRPRPASAAAAPDKRVDDIERRVDDLDRKLDNRFMWLLAAFAAGFITLGGVILNRTDATNEKLGAKIDAVSMQLGGKIDTVGQRVSDLSERTARIEARLPGKR